MQRELIASFAVRLRDLLGTLETTALLGGADIRMRGLGEQLQFACMAVPCEEALVAIELETLGRLRVPGVATAEGWRTTDLELLPTGTPFAYLLGGGGGFSAELEPGDEMVGSLATVLESEPRHAIFVPIRIGATVLGGAALLRAEAAEGDRELSMAERLAEVLALTLETHRTERVLVRLFATVLPDLCAPDAPTDFLAELSSYIHRLRVSPPYRDRLALAEVVGRLASCGREETRLATDVLARLEDYVRGLEGGEKGDAIDAAPVDELYE